MNNRQLLLKRSLITSSAIILSRFSGLLREFTFAYVFGASAHTDAFQIAFRIPNLLRDLFAESALSGAFTPIFNDIRETQGEVEAKRFVDQAASCLAIITAVVVFIGIAMSDPIVRAFTQQSFQENIAIFHETVTMTKLMMPFLLFVSLAALCMSILNSNHSFFLPSLASAFFNLGSILFGLACAWLLARQGIAMIIGMAIGTSIGGFLQFFVQYLKVRHLGFSFHFKPHFNAPEIMRLASLMVPAILSVAALQINQLVNTNFASQLAAGSLSWISYAFRVMMLPLGVIGVAISIVVLPTLAKLNATDAINERGKTIVDALCFSFLVMIPVASLFILYPDAIIKIIFEHGSFDSNDTYQTAAALRYYSIGLVGMAGTKILSQSFFALKKPSWPAIVSALAVAINIIAVITLIDPLQHLAIPVATALSLSFNFILQLALVSRIKTGFSYRYFGREFGRIVLAVIPMISINFFVLKHSFFITSHDSFSITLIKTFIIFASSILFYFSLLVLLRSSHARELLRTIVRRKQSH